MIEQEGPESVAAVFIEPVQNSGGTFTPPEGYCRGVREICDEYGILLVADEVICGFGRLGDWFGSERYDIRPDLITFAKGIGSAYVPLGGVLITDKVAAPFMEGTNIINHGITYGGHPVACAVALKNLEVMEREDVLGNVRRNEDYFRELLDKLGEKPIVGDVRGAGYFMSLELVKDKETKQTFNDEESEYLLRGFLSGRLLRGGPDLPRRRPRRPGHPAVAAADRDARGPRPHPRDPRHRARRGLGGDALASQPPGRARVTGLHPGRC